jgi:hypothetical protein
MVITESFFKRLNFEKVSLDLRFTKHPEYKAAFPKTGVLGKPQSSKDIFLHYNKISFLWQSVAVNHVFLFLIWLYYSQAN